MQLLKWVGNKQRLAQQIVRHIPASYGTYYEPFLGSGAVLGALRPTRAVASDALRPLVEIWRALKEHPEELKQWYADRYALLSRFGKVAAYDSVRSAYNQSPNAADLLFVCRACYAGIVRFRLRDGGISTPCGVHNPIAPESFSRRVDHWTSCVAGTTFEHSDFEPVLDDAAEGDVVYCDPPYSHSQSILYGAQNFDLPRLLNAIDRCKARGVRVVLSIDGSKRSGDLLCDVPIPPGLFRHELFLDCGRSMLRRFQLRGRTLEAEKVKDRLLVT